LLGARDPGGTPPALDFATTDDPGLFGPDSVAWRVHADRSMLVGGVRALFLQVLHPLAMAGVAQRSAYREDPLGRLSRTGRFIAATTYGSTAEAEASIAVVRTVHEHVRGTTSDGRPYAATDPALLAWVHNVEVESFLEAYRRYGPGLDDADADHYVAIGWPSGSGRFPSPIRSSCDPRRPRCWRFSAGPSAHRRPRCSKPRSRESIAAHDGTSRG
jgi:uncharacterized protein (DUF2236 family)